MFSGFACFVILTYLFFLLFGRSMSKGIINLLKGFLGLFYMIYYAIIGKRREK